MHARVMQYKRRNLLRGERMDSEITPTPFSVPVGYEANQRVI